MKNTNTKKQIKDSLSAPFLVWETTPRRKWVLFTLIMLFAIAFKLIYHPFGIGPDSGMLFFIHHAAITATILLFQLFLLPKIFAGYFHHSKRNLGRQILWFFILLLLLIVFHGIYNIFSSYNMSFYDAFMDSVWINIGIGIYPIIFIVLLAYIRQLTKYPIQKPTLKEIKEPIQPLLISNISVQSIGYIKSLDNYSEIHFLKGKKVIRKSLNSLEKELEKHGFIRVHRSYIVNQSYVKLMEGNANKSSLVLQKFDHVIPVARSKRQSVLKTIAFLTSNKG